MKTVLLSITASHYRKRIYQLLDKEFNCDFIFGVDDTSVKRMDTSTLKNSVDIPNNYLYNSKWYIQKGLISKTKGYKTVIDDLGAFCISSWLLLFTKFFRKQKVYCWDHAWYGRESFIRKWMKRLYFGLADGTFVYGNYARDLMIKNGFDGNKLYVIHNSLDYDEQLKLRSQTTINSIYKKHFINTNPTLCFIGRLTTVKRLDLLIDALHILNRTESKFNLIIVGDGEKKSELEAKVKLYGLERAVWFYGACYDEKQNAELIYNADLCVAPGNIGLTAMHAMMFGCPCLSHNDFPWQMPEFEAIIDGVTGCFFKRDDSLDLANKISEWFIKKQDKREEVRHACFKEIDENWTPQFQLNVIKKVIYE